jgi:hypothetical protein
MIASLGFKKQLWTLDKSFDVVWNELGKKWEIWKFPGQEEKKKKVWNDQAFHVMTVQTKDKDYRQLGADIFLSLQKGDTRKFSAKQLAAYFDAIDRNVMRAKEKKLIDEIHARNKDWAWYATAVRQPVPKEYIFETPNTLRVQRAIAGGL